MFIINTDRHLLVVNHEAEIISQQRIPELLEAKSLIILDMEDGYKGVPFERTDLLLYFTNEYMFCAEIFIKYERGLIKSKNLCNIDISFASKPSIAHFEWTAHFAYLHRISLLICWNQSETFVFTTPRKLNQKIELMHVFDKIMKRNKLYESDNKINAF